MLTTVLLAIHVTGGVLALVTGVVAIGVQLFKGAHRLHVLAGRLFVVAMIMVVASALPLSVIINSVLLALIGVFSGYLMLVGWRLAKNRNGRAAPLDWTLDGVMGIGSLVMVNVAVLRWGDNGLVLLVFGVLGAFLVGGHVVLLRQGPIRGRLRIGTHLQFMIAAFIATVTAFLVVNNVLGIFGWFLPTVLLTPVIVVWRAGSQLVRRPRWTACGKASHALSCLRERTSRADPTPRRDTATHGPAGRLLPVDGLCWHPTGPADRGHGDEPAVER